MRSRTVSALAAMLMACAAPALPQEEHALPKVRTAPDHLVGDEATAVDLYKKVLPSVVTIFTTHVRAGRTAEEAKGIGSGVLISRDRKVLTAAHVVEDARQILVTVHDGRVFPAELLYSASTADIALIQLLGDAEDLEFAALGDSDHLAVGQRTYVVGAPLGLENSFSLGHISAFREFDRLFDGTILAEYIQTDAAINAGNSGGPVFNSAGEVIGIASRILTMSGGFEGLGFAVAINTAKQLLALEDRPWLGIDTIFLNRKGLARLLQVDREGGLLIQSVTPGSPADQAGLRGGSIPALLGEQEILLGGDLILEFNTQEACHDSCLSREGGRLAGLDHIPIRFLRGGKERQVNVDVSRTRRNFLKDLQN